MHFELGQIIIIGLILVFTLVLALFLTNSSIFNGKKESNNIFSKEEQDHLDTVFFLYKHDSVRHWLEWIMKQNDETKEKAATQLKLHLNGSIDDWGNITSEALECIRTFHEFALDEFLANFLEKCSSSWNSNRFIPDFFYKASDILAEINPELASKAFSYEIMKKGSTQAFVERKRALIEKLPILKDHCETPMVDILTNTNESLSTKAFCLKKVSQCESPIKENIYLKSLRNIVDQQKRNRSDFLTEESIFLESLIDECLNHINRYDFYKVISDACSLIKLHRLVVKSIVKLLNSTEHRLNNYSILGLASLKDTDKEDIGRNLAKIHSLDSDEIYHVVVPKVSKNLSRNELIYGDNLKLQLPIPAIYKKFYEDFKSRFFENMSSHDYVTSEKIFGGLLVTGNEQIEKLYFSRALAQEKNWNFLIIDIEKMNNKPNFDKICSEFNKLRKPYMLYIFNPHLLFNKDGSPESFLREKFIQILGVQSLDSKSFIVGDIDLSNEDLYNSSFYNNLSSMRNKFFPQAIEMNQKEQKFKTRIVEEYLKFIAPKRIENKRSLINQFCAAGEKMSILEFSFFVIKYLRLMLLIFGKETSLNSLNELENQFFLQGKEVFEFEQNQDLNHETDSEFIEK